MFDTTFHPLLTFTSGFLTLYPRIFQEAIPGPPRPRLFTFSTLLNLIEPKHQKQQKNESSSLHTLCKIPIFVQKNRLVKFNLVNL